MTESMVNNWTLVILGAILIVVSMNFGLNYYRMIDTEPGATFGVVAVMALVTGLFVALCAIVLAGVFAYLGPDALVLFTSQFSRYG